MSVSIYHEAVTLKIKNKTTKLAVSSFVQELVSLWFSHTKGLLIGEGERKKEIAISLCTVTYVAGVVWFLHETACIKAFVCFFKPES